MHNAFLNPLDIVAFGSIHLGNEIAVFDLALPIIDVAVDSEIAV